MNKRKKLERRASRGDAHNAAHYAMGRRCVEELLRHAPLRVKKLYLAERGDPQGASAAQGVLALAKSAAISVENRPAAELTRWVNSESHQGIVAEISPAPSLSLHDFLEQTAEREHVMLLILDNIMDPHNLGAIWRAAECLGADGLLVQNRRSAAIGAVARKVSVGASELVPHIVVSNLADAAAKLKERGFWLIAAATGQNSQDLQDFEFPKRSALVLGSESEGIKPLLLRQCDFEVRIPMAGRIDSLNVSQAAAVLLHGWQASLRKTLEN